MKKYICVCFILMGLCSKLVYAEMMQVSAVQLVVLPEKYDKRMVTVTGYFSGSPDYLFIHKDSSDLNDISSGVKLDPESMGKFNECFIGYIAVEGMFTYTDGRPKISKIESIYSFDKKRECKITKWAS